VTPAATSAERLCVNAIGIVAAQSVEGIVQRQRLDLSISRSEHDAELTTARKTISRELHDGPTQDLALAGLTLDRLVQSLGEDQAVSADARQARDLIDRAVLGMRKAIGKLRSTQPPAPSITGPLRELLAEIAPTAPGLEVNFQEVSGVRLAPEVERAMIGIVREALHNVRKHANAESVRLEVRRVDDEVEIAVIDDGIGFEGPSPTGHFGLEQIRELAEETGGRLETRSSRGTGTSVKAWIPLSSPTSSQRRRA
jgi:signal transduction histidine kinase